MLTDEDYEGGIEGKYVYCNNCKWLKKMQPFGKSKHWQREKVWSLSDIKEHWPVACETDELYEEIREKLGYSSSPTITLSARQSVQWFANEMEKKLRKNDWKGGWSECSFDWLWDLLNEEIDELSTALDEVIDEQNIVTNEDLISECADIANFAMMIADNARKKIEEQS